MTRKHSYKDLFMGAVVGGTLGAMSALLFGTAGGKHLQRKFKSTMSKLDLAHNLPKMATMRMIKNKIQRKIKASLKSKLHTKRARPASAKRKHHA